MIPNFLRKDAFFWLGCLVGGALAFDLFANFGNWYEFFWFCPVTSAFLAYALFRRNTLIITMCLVLAIPGQAIWIWDFILHLFGRSMGRMDALFMDGEQIFVASVLTHTLLIPTAAWAVWRLGFNMRALVPVWIYTITMQLMTYFFTPIEMNINCVFYHCDMSDPGDGYTLYFIWRSLIPWIFIVFISYTILSLVYVQRRVPIKNNANNA